MHFKWVLIFFVSLVAILHCVRAYICHLRTIGIFVVLIVCWSSLLMCVCVHVWTVEFQSLTSAHLYNAAFLHLFSLRLVTCTVDNYVMIIIIIIIWYWHRGDAYGWEDWWKVMGASRRIYAAQCLMPELGPSHILNLWLWITFTNYYYYYHYCFFYFDFFYPRV